MSIGRAILLIGSAKPKGTSTSDALARHLARGLEAAGVIVDTIDIVGTRSDTGAAHLAESVAAADLFVLVSPLYVDSLPYLVTRAFESLASRRVPAPARPCRFAALIHCGFPEAAQCRTAIDMTRVFARRASFGWAGALALGESGLIDGRELNEVGSVARNVRAALDSAAVALAQGQPIPDEAVKRMAQPLVPAPLYTFVGNMGWRRQARRNGVRRQLNARPFEPER